MQIRDFDLVKRSKDLPPIFGPEEANILEDYRQNLDQLIIKDPTITFHRRQQLMGESMRVVAFLNQYKTWD